MFYFSETLAALPNLIEQVIASLIFCFISFCFISASLIFLFHFSETLAALPNLIEQVIASLIFCFISFCFISASLIFLFHFSETLAALPNLVEQVIASLQSFLKEHEKEPLDTTVITALKTQLSDLQDSQHRITTLITQRCLAFFRQILSSPTTRTNLPTPFLILQVTLQAFL